jgi:murein tripeptide amidase MpaA
VTPFAHDRYLTHDELGAWLEQRVAAAPQLAALSTIGASRRGRPIWCATLTNAATGPAADKPAFHIDANNHGEEVITSAVALFTIDLLLDGYGRDPEVTELLDTRAVYVIPRLNPDGAEVCLTTPYRTVGNGRHLPWEEHQRGLHPEDVDGDGRVLQMLVPDPKGEWRRSERDPRLLVQREPGEVGGAYLRLLPEGVLRDWDGVTHPIEKPRHGNLNRQFPIHWAPEYGEYGAGELPLVEPEAAALARFVLDHPNIAGVQAYHSHGAIILRPSSHMYDADLDPDDLDTFKTLGAVGTRLTGYPVLSTFESFTADKRNPRHGGFTEWCYQHLGLIGFTNELWNVEREVGMASGRFFEDAADGEELQLALLAWAETHAPDAFAPWTPCDHPQLGEVLVGGWDPFRIHRNPPPAFIAQVAEPNARFTIRHALASPRLVVERAELTQVEGGVYRLRAAVANEGYLPTHLTRRALAIGVVDGVTVDLELPAGAELVAGEARTAVGHLAGRDTRRGAYDPWRRPWGEPTRLLTWVVRFAGEPADVVLHAHAPKAGRATATVPPTPARRS